MEYYSDMDRRTIGGPWRAKEEGCTYFIYYFINSDVFFIFYTSQLVDLLDIITKDMVLIKIPNVRWITAGYKINQEILKPIAYISGINESNTFIECIDALQSKSDKFDFQGYLKSIKSKK